VWLTPSDFSFMWLSTFLMDQLGYIWHDTSHNHLNINAKISSSYPCSLLSYGCPKQTYGHRQRLYVMNACVCSSVGVTVLSLVSHYLTSSLLTLPRALWWVLNCQNNQANSTVYCLSSKSNVIYEFGLWTKKVGEPLLWRLEIALPSAITLLCKLL